MGGEHRARSCRSLTQLMYPLQGASAAMTAHSQQPQQMQEPQRSYPSPGSDAGPPDASPRPSPDRSPTASAAASRLAQPQMQSQPSVRSSQRMNPPDPGGNSAAAPHSNGTILTAGSGGVAARIAALEGGAGLSRQSSDAVSDLTSQLDDARCLSMTVHRSHYIPARNFSHSEALCRKARVLC